MSWSSLLSFHISPGLKEAMGREIRARVFSSALIGQVHTGDAASGQAPAGHPLAGHALAGHPQGVSLHYMSERWVEMWTLAVARLSSWVRLHYVLESWSGKCRDTPCGCPVHARPAGRVPCWWNARWLGNVGACDHPLNQTTSTCGLLKTP